MQPEPLENENYVFPPPPEEIPVAEIIYTPDNPPWGVLGAIGVWILSLAFIVVLPSLFLIPYLAQQNLDLSDRAAATQFVDTDPMAIFLRIAAVIPAHILTLVVAWAVITRIRKFSFRKVLGWASGGIRWWHYLMILGGFYVVAAGVGYFLPEQDNEMTRLLASSRSVVFVIAFLATFSAPLVEEVVYRGLLYSALRRNVGVALTIIIVTAMFAGVHFFQYWGSPGTILLICLLSLILTLVRYRTKSLLPCIILHTLINGFQSLFLILAPYMQKDEAQALVHLVR
jgi:uncharacterized protein